MAQKGLPIGIQDFSEIIEGNFVYVDKTEFYHRLITKGNYYFLSRPRRFGKSLLISTLKQIFAGNRELFQGLWIYDKIDWEPRPVILLDFTRISKIANRLDDGIAIALKEIADGYGLTLDAETNAGRLQQMIVSLSKDRKVAILVDEYDKPLIDNIDDLEVAEQNRKSLKSMYSVLKGNDSHIAFLFLTGVTKFSQVSIFSDLNNLNDISLNENFSQMLGYTQAEILEDFPEYLDRLKAKLADHYPDVMAEMNAWYHGYSWDGEHFVYNPFSILNLLSNREFGYYWFATGTPTFLMKLIRSRAYSIFDLENMEVSLHTFNKFDIAQIEIKSLLFQTGYLTIKERNRQDQSVTLDFPNKEVATAFSIHLLTEFAEKSQESTDSLVRKMSSYLRKGDIDGFMGAMQALFADIAYPIQPSKGTGISGMEKYYHSMFYLVLRLLGYNVHAEVFTNTGRIDTVITTEKYIYVVEFKLGDAASALAQIKAKGYHQKYAGSGKEVILLGIGFDTETRNVQEFLVEAVG
jgi:Predicted AAA-ATPase/PD-(D/E)XK nuclease superfamily